MFFTTRALLTIAFVVILGLFALAGFEISRQAEVVHTQARDMLEDGLPSLENTARLQEELPRLSVAERAFLARVPEGDRSLVEALGAMQALVDREERAERMFPGEREAIQEVDQSLSRLQAAERQASRDGTQDPRAPSSIRLEAAIADLAASCQRFEQINRSGSERAKETLLAVSALEQRVVWGTLCFAALGAILLGSLLTRSIAGPLSRLTEALARYREGDPAPPVVLSAPVPREIDELVKAFRNAAERSKHLLEERQAAHRLLEASLEREHVLNLDLDAQVQAKTAALEEANQHLQQLVVELRHRDRLKTSFLALVSHELRTPLAVIKGAALTLIDLGNKLEQEASKRLLAHIPEEADRLSSMVEDLLDAARLEAGTFKIAPEPDLDLKALASEVADSLEGLFAARRISLVRILPNEVPGVYADPLRCRQVIRNLLENACKFSPEGTAVTMVLTLERAEAPASLGLVLAVEDEGPGIPDELWPRLFTPFARAAEDSGHGGTGLGLTIARQLIEAHQGQIGAINLPFGGSRFWIRLPLRGDRPQAMAARETDRVATENMPSPLD